MCLNVHHLRHYRYRPRHQYLVLAKTEGIAQMEKVAVVLETSDGVVCQEWPMPMRGKLVDSENMGLH